MSRSPWSEARALGTVRVLLGALVLVRTTALFELSRTSPSPLLGWPTPAWHVAVFGLALPPAVVAALCVGRTLSAAAFTLGVRASATGPAAAALGWMVLSQDALGYVNTLHLLYLAMLVLGLAGAGASVALRPEPIVDLTSGVALVRALVVSVYAWSGLAKLNGSWLSGEALAQFHAAGIVRGRLADVALASHARCAAAAWVVVAVELSLGPLLLWRATRRAAVAVVVALHLSLEASVHPDVFGLAMLVLALAFTGNHPATPPPRQATR
jgi:hypothetical protein